MSETKRYTVTAALPYANGPVHIGHLAGVYVPADIYVRYLRSKKRNVLFVCGSDEHGVAITMRARKEGKTPQQIVDIYNQMISDSFSKFGISFDIYSRTSSETHRETAQEFFKSMHAAGEFEERTSEQYYDEKYNQFLADRYITGTCPSCGKDGAYGDQCESCGTSLSPEELISPKSTLSGESPIKKQTSHWYLPLDKHESWLKEWIVEGNKDYWKPNVYGQCKSWLDLGLKPRAITRDLDWGVPVPLKNADGKVLYVWFDAPIGYISATKEWAAQNDKEWEPYWKDKDTKLLHFIGKDNIVFHCIIFPAILKSHGEFILPNNVPANEFMNLEGQKISTSRNWAVWLHEYLEDFPGKEDVLRYVLCANAPETKDNDFTWKDFQARNNNELAAILGNFVKRAVDFTTKNFGGEIPAASQHYDPELELIQKIKEAPTKIAEALENYKFREAQNAMIDLARSGNKYLADTEPWKVIKEDKARAGGIMNLALQTVANLAILSEPFLPNTSKALFQMVGLPIMTWDQAGFAELAKPGTALGESIVLFSKIEDEDIEAQVKKLENSKVENSMNNTQELKENPYIEFEDFMKVELKIGEILTAEKLEKSKKLLLMSVDVGEEKPRTILSGIAEHYSAEEVIGKQVSVVTNLAPRKMMGHVSQGMILLAEDDGKLVFVSPENSIGNGSQIR